MPGSTSSGPPTGPPSGPSHETVGVHLLPSAALIDSPRRSAVARVDAAGVLVGLDLADTDAAILALIPPAVATVVLDAPIAVPATGGRRDVERVLAWCDIAAFPVSAARMEQVHGGARGPALAAALARPGRTVLEGLPDLVMRQLAWEVEHPVDAPAIALADYRAAWLGVRGPHYRPKGAGRARAAGLAAARGLLARALDLDGWAPHARPDDWQAINDAGCLDALCCALTARRLGDGRAVVVGTPERGQMALPVDANLRDRLDATLARMRATGEVQI